MPLDYPHSRKAKRAVRKRGHPDFNVLGVRQVGRGKAYEIDLLDGDIALVGMIARTNTVAMRILPSRKGNVRGSGPSGGYTKAERDSIPSKMFLKPSTRSWPVSDRRHVSIALQYMQRGFGNRSEYPKLLARMLKLWPERKHPGVFREIEEKIPSIAQAMGGNKLRAAANPTPLEAEVQRMMDHPPASWQMMFQRYGLKTGDSPQKVINVVLEFTPSMSDYGPKGKGGFVPPASTRKAALLGLRLSYENDYTSASGIGVARAMQLALSPTISQRSVSRMAAYFGRHKKDQNARNFGNIDNPSRGYMAWLNWGGTPGYEWALKQVRAKPNPRRAEKCSG